MNELTFIPLKTSDGQVAGHARVQDGLVEFHLRAAAGAQALILTETGYVTGETGAHIRAGGRVLCVALHDRGLLRCCGFARGCAYTANDVRARLTTLFPPQPVEVRRPEAPAKERCAQAAAQKKTNAEPNEPCREIPPVRETPACPPAREAPACPSARETPACPSAREAPACPSAREAPACPPEPDAPALTKLARARAATQPQKSRPVGAPCQAPCAEPAAIPADRPEVKQDLSAEPAAMPCGKPQDGREAEAIAAQAAKPHAAQAGKPAKAADADGDVRQALERLNDESAAAFFGLSAAAQESPDDTAGRAESFAALLERCEAVFQKIAASPEQAADEAKQAQPDAPVRAEAQADPRRAAIDAWNDSVDALLTFPVTAAAQADDREPVRAPVTNPFPHIFPDARFYSECDSSGTHMLIGTWRRGTEQFTVTAVRGEYSPRPPSHLPGFTRYIRTRQGGFWVRVDD